MAIDPKQLPDDPKILREIVLDLIAQLESASAEKSKIENLLRELLDAKRGRKSEQLSADQLALFETALVARFPELEAPAEEAAEENGGTPPAGQADNKKKRGGRKPLSRDLKRERIVHDIKEEEKHCAGCNQDLRHIGEETSERYEYIPASLMVVEDACLKYACDCTVRTAGKPPQPIEKSTAGASVLAQVIVGKFADHLPLHRQEQIFERHGVDISRKTMGGWMGQCSELMTPLYKTLQGYIFESKVLGTDDTTVKVLDPALEYARTGRFWTYCGDKYHPGIIYDYTPTREGAGPAEFLKPFRGYLQADAYAGYDALFKDPARGVIEVGCWAHSRRHFHKALKSDEPHLGPVMALIARLYHVESKARMLNAADRLFLRQLHSRSIMDKLHGYLLELQKELLPKSPAAKAVNYALNHWTALARFLEDGDLEIDNNATERSIRGIAVGRHNWMFVGSDNGGKTAAVLRSFAETCKLIKIDPFAWFQDVLTRIAIHPITRLAELLPHNWAAARAVSL